MEKMIFYKNLNILSIKKSLFLLLRLIIVVYFCGFVNFRIANKIVQVIGSESSFGDALTHLIHTLLSLAAVILFFPRSLAKVIFVERNKNTQIGWYIAIFFPFLLTATKSFMYLWSGSSWQFFVPSLTSFLFVCS